MCIVIIIIIINRRPFGKVMCVVLACAVRPRSAPDHSVCHHHLDLSTAYKKYNYDYDNENDDEGI